MKTILIVDDDKDIIDFLRLRLEGSMYVVLSATNAKTGIELAKQGKPDLILMDVMMPHLTGGEAVHQLKLDPRTSNIPVIFLTAIMSDAVDQEPNHSINVDGHFYPAIAKPFKSENLLHQIQLAIGASN